MQKGALGCLGLIVVAVVILLIGGCGSYNRLVGLSQDVDKKWADVQTQYQRRYELIPNLVNTVSGAANFEKSTVIAVTTARASVGQVKMDSTTAPTDPAKMAEFQAAQGQVSSALSRLLVVAENYPDLKATANFRDLQAQLEGTENRISVERTRFNESAQTYNTAVKRFPTVLFAGMMGFVPKAYFQGVTGSEAAPKVDFNFGSPAPVR